MRAALAAHSDLLDSFGGHPMAAGFSISPDRIPELRRRLIRTVVESVGEGLPERELPIEAYISIPGLSLHLAEELGRLAPFGRGNPPIYLATPRLTVASSRRIGRTGEHRMVELQDEDGHAVSAFWWQSSGLPVPEGKFDLAYILRTDRFRGELSVQLEWVDARGVKSPPVQLPPAVPVPDTADYRCLPEPLPVLRALWEEGQMQLWAEAVDVSGFAARTRCQLREMPALVVWTMPPAAGVLAEALAAARPMRVYLFAVDPGLDVPRVFLRRLTGLVKHALHAYAGRLDWSVVAAAMAHRVETVQTGVEWLIGRGRLSLTATEAAAVVVRDGGKSDLEAAQQVRARLEDLLAETAAYRRYFRETDAQSLVAVGG